MYKLIIVDDEIETREALCHYFPWDEIGFEVVGQFENGRQALEYVRNQPVDVVFSDIRMPVMTGIELAKEMLQLKTRPILIFLSGYADFEFAKQAIIYGVKDYVLKPAKYKELHEVFSRIKEALESMSVASGPPQLQEEVPPLKEYNYDEEVITSVKRYIDNHYRTANLSEASHLV